MSYPFPETTIISRFEKIVREYPENVAIDETHRIVTFSELRNDAITISRQIIGRIGKKRRLPIAVLLNESAVYTASILGILYSGNFYVPINTQFPKTVKEKILNSIQPSLIITDLEHIRDLIICSIPVARALLVENVACPPDTKTEILPIPNVLDSDPIYVMHTSGSTGQPKGVVIQHRGVIDYISWVGRTFQIDSRTVMGSLNSFSFDNSILELFSMVFFGSRLVFLRDRYDKQDAKDLIRLMNEARINFIFWVPSTLKHIANTDALAYQRPEYLSKILFCGEIMPNKHLNYWRRYYPDAVFANLYGPTEITDACSCYIIDRTFSDEDPLPIGYARDNMELLIIDQNREVARGEIGEIYVKGTSISPGYWNAPEETAEGFVQNPLHKVYPDIVYKTGDLARVNDRGELLFMGRKDTQVKFYGTRVELTEIERTATMIEGVKNACVLFLEELNKIVMIYEADRELNKYETILTLKSSLIAYPTEFIRVERLPFNANGKVDRVTLERSIREKLNTGEKSY
jgi:amino acid adenylation domain-containing protein